MINHRILHPILLGFALFCITACSSQAGVRLSQPDPTSPAVSPTFTPTAPPVKPTEKAASTPTPLPGRQPTATPVQGYAYTKNCIAIQDALPKDVNPGGELMLYDMDHS